MKVEKAIKIMEGFFGCGPYFSIEERTKAIKLGIEALKVVQSNRIYGYPNKIPKLPGETKD